MRLALCCTCLLLTACEGAIWDRTEVAPPAVPHAPGGRVAQYCTFHGSDDLAKVNDYLRRQAESGWELVGIGGGSATVYCFKSAVSGP